MQTLLSGVQTSSQPHLGNYLGAIKNWVNMQNDYDSFFFAGDLHAITTPQDPKKLAQHTQEIVAFYLASGLNPEKATVFIQSHVHEHAELAWVLTCFSYMGEMSRMTQFKDKSKKQGANISVGLFSYPTLMAADILLYQPDFVPVGEDQKQHVEITRDIAMRMNSRYGIDIFKIPQPLIQAEGARIMDLQTPNQKMSKSAENTSGVVFIDDDDKTIAKKIRSAVTDSGANICFDGASPGLMNLLQIYKAITGKPQLEIEKYFEGKMYGHLKIELAELVVNLIAPIRNERKKLLQDPQYLKHILSAGREKAKLRAAQTLSKVYDAVGFLPK